MYVLPNFKFLALFGSKAIHYSFVSLNFRVTFFFTCFERFGKYFAAIPPLF